MQQNYSHDWKDFMLELDEVRFSMKEIGQGNHILLCFHGFAQDKNQFPPLFPSAVPEGWRVISIDQPLFGKTLWPASNPIFDDTLLHQFWLQLYQQYPQGIFYPLGFSMGGRTAMKLFLTSPKPIKHVFLISAAGIYDPALFRFLLHTDTGTHVFNALLDWKVPHTFVQGLDFLANRGWFDRRNYSFLSSQLANEKREKRFRRFMQIYQGLEVHLADITKRTQEMGTHWHIIWGQHDKVLPLSLARTFERNVPNTQIQEVNGKHLIIESNTEIVKTLLWEHMQSLYAIASAE